MLYQATSLFGFRLQTRDNEEMGHVHDCYFDRQDWIVRYLVADIGSWFFGRKVLIATSALGIPDWDAKTLPVTMTKAEVKASPETDLAMPVTRQHERALINYYNWPTYWAEPFLSSASGVAPLATPGPTAVEQLPTEVVEGLQNSEESHLHSMVDTQGYDLEALDGTIGHVSDFVIDSQGWAIRYLVIDTSNWLAGRKVLISPQWVERIEWDDARLYLNVRKEVVANSPEQPADLRLDRVYERELHRHYGYPEYW
jgi:hypothetical protein